MTARSLRSILAEPTCKHHPPFSFPRHSLTWLCRRVCQVELHGDRTFTLKSQKYRVSEALKTGEATVLFGARTFTFTTVLKSKRLLFNNPSTPPRPSRDFQLGHSHHTHDGPQITSPIPSMPSLHQI